jgi:hypothetical protein
MIVVIITQEFAETNKGFKKEERTFDYSELNTGEYICSLESIKEFPELFNNLTITLKDITPDDFKQQNNG